MNRDISDPLERLIADGLNALGVKWEHPDHPIRLDFYLPDYNTYIEVKQFYTPRTEKQLEYHKGANIILLQGKEAVRTYLKMLGFDPFLPGEVRAPQPEVANPSSDSGDKSPS